METARKNKKNKNEHQVKSFIDLFDLLQVCSRHVTAVTAKRQIVAGVRV